MKNQKFAFIIGIIVMLNGFLSQINVESLPPFVKNFLGPTILLVILYEGIRFFFLETGSMLSSYILFKRFLSLAFSYWKITVFLILYFVGTCFNISLEQIIGSLFVLGVIFYLYDKNKYY